MKDWKNLFQFLKTYKTQKGQEFTHTSLSGGSFNIPEDQLDYFYDAYSQALKNKVELCLTERKMPNTGIITIDLDFRNDIEPQIEICDENIKKDKQKNNNLERKYTLDQLIEFCSKIIEINNEYLVEPNNEYFIFQRPKPRIDGTKIKDGVHIMFPYINVDYKYHHFMRLKMLPNVSSIFASCNYINTAEDIFDDKVISTNNWMMYGSTKPNVKPYNLIYPKKFNKKKKEIVEIVKLFSIRNKKDITTIKEDKNNELIIENDKKKIKSSENVNNKYTNLIVSNEEENAIKQLLEQYSHYWPEHDLDNFELRKKLCGLDAHYFARLTHPHADEKVICPFKGEPHTRKSCPIYLHISREGIVMKCNDSSPMCQGKTYPFKHIPIPQTYKNIIFNQHNLTIVHNYANEEVKYDKKIFDADKDNITIFDNPTLNELLLIGLSKTHYDMAKLLYNLYKNDYIYVNERSGQWFEYLDHRWHRKTPSLKQKISEDLQEYYEKLKTYYENETKITQDSRDDKIKIIENLINKLKDAPFKKNVMSEAADFFENDDFLIQADSKRNLLCFENGVYDFEKLEFRKGKKEDFITMSTCCDYIEYDENNDKIKEINEFLYKLLPNTDKREYTIKLIASCLAGHTHDEKFHIWTGTASNGKSKFIELISESLGQYSFSVPIALLTHKRGSSGAANPELARGIGKRFGYLQEPDKGDEINVGLMKEITGGDKLTARKLFGDIFEYKPQFKLVLCCNDLPKIPSSDQGTWRRLRVIEFTSKFTDNPNPDNPNEFKKDKDIPQKINTWRSAFMSLLIRYYHKYMEEGLKDPSEILKYTLEYEKENDRYNDYIVDYVVKDPKDAIKWQDVYDNYTRWFKRCYVDEKIDRSKEIKKRFESILGDKVKSVRNLENRIVKGWKGYRLKFIDDDEDEDEDEYENENNVKNENENNVKNEKFEKPSLTIEDKL